MLQHHQFEPQRYFAVIFGPDTISEAQPTPSYQSLGGEKSMGLSIGFLIPGT
jgi:hypothetical protein